MPQQEALIPKDRDVVFPDSFRFGVTDADLQVVGEDYTVAEEGSQPTIWTTFTEKRGLDRPGICIDRYHRWPEDVAHMQRMGLRYYRTSISMARLLTENGVNERAVSWYKRYFEALRDAGITLLATLYHWELPQYLQDKGGWTNRETAYVLQRHAETVARNFDEFISEYSILNEPWCSSMLSYYEGIHAPGAQFESSRDNLRAGVHAAHNLLLGQGLAFRAIKEIVPDAKIGTGLNFEPAYAASTQAEDLQAARNREGYYNRWFVEAIYKGRYPQDMVELYGPEAMPHNYEADMDTICIGSQLHALSVNYYRGATYKAGGGELKSEQVLVEDGPVNDLGWPIYVPPAYAEGLYDLLQQLYFSYRDYGLRSLYIGENGMALATPPESQLDKKGLIDDGPRIEYYKEHLRQVHKAILHGVPVDAFFAWTLMDNFEWSEGYKPGSAFGLIHVDRATMKRTWKRSAAWYARVMQSRSLARADVEAANPLE